MVEKGHLKILPAYAKASTDANALVDKSVGKGKNKNKNKMENINILAKNNGFSFIGWKSYNRIKKKAMEQEFSWSGLIISLSIAFFVVLASAQILSIIYQSMEKARQEKNLVNQNIYRLESVEYIDFQTSGALEKFFSPPSVLV